MIYETNYLMHYNKNHDKLGRFAKGTGGEASRTIRKINKKVDKAISKNKLNSKKAARYLNILDSERVNNEFVKDRTNRNIEKFKNKDRDTSKMSANLDVLNTNTKAISDLGKYIVDNTSGSIFKEPLDKLDSGIQAQNKQMVNSMLYGVIGSAVIASRESTKPGYWYTYKNNKKGTRIKVK